MFVSVSTSTSRTLHAFLFNVPRTLCGLCGRNSVHFMRMKNNKLLLVWGEGWGSNPRLTEPQSVVLPIELPPPYFAIVCFYTKFSNGGFADISAGD